MKFRLVEDINDKTSDIEDELRIRNKEREDILNQVSEILQGEDFEETKKLNGISFNKTINKDEFDLNAQFYIDTTDYNYSAYISIEEKDESTVNFSLKGNFDNMLDGVSKLIYHLNHI